MRFRGRLAFCILFLLWVNAAFAAEWYQAYEKGYKAVEKGKCAEGIPLLQEALAKNPKPDLQARPYGMITWEYIPHYYLAKCAFNAGDYEGAKSYMDSAMKVDMYSSSKSADFRTMKKAVDEKLGLTKPPATSTPTTTTTTPTTTPAKPPVTTQPPATSPGSERLAMITRYLNDAKTAYAAGDYQTANDDIDRVMILDRSNQDALRLKAQISQKEAATATAQLKQQRADDARKALNRGDLITAENIALELRASYPDDRNIQSLAGEIDRAKDEKMKSMQASDSKKFMERQVISAFYTGKYNAAIELAEQAVTQFPDSWRLLFYQGCAYAALSILEEKNQDQRLNQARESFRKAKTIAGGDIPQPPQISPKIMDVYRSS